MPDMSIHQLVAGHSEYHKPSSTRDESLMEWKVTYEGCVIQTFERNGSWDSDFFAIVWDEEAQAVRQVEYATTRFWTYANSATVDITPENLAKAQVWKREQMLRDAKLRDRAEARNVHVEGRAVRILPTASGRDRRSKGEVIPQGTVAYVAASVVDPYRTPTYRYGGTVPHSYKVVLQVEGFNRLVYLPDDAVEVIDPEQYERSDEEIDAMVPAAEHIDYFHTATPGYISAVGPARVA